MWQYSETRQRPVLLVRKPGRVWEWKGNGPTLFSPHPIRPARSGFLSVEALALKDSHRLIADAIRGIRPERTPIFDILANDRVIEHFGGGRLDGSNDRAISTAACSSALDGTRHIYVPDVPGRTWYDEVGNLRVAARYTQWVQEHALRDPGSWAKWIAGHIERLEAEQPPTQAECANTAQEQKGCLQELGELVFIHCTPSTAINWALFVYCGVEMFSYLWADDRELVLRWLRAIEALQRRYVELRAHAENCDLAMVYSDVAFKGRLMFSREMFNEMGFFDDVAAICAQCHEKGLRLIFHSDGYIMDIVPDLVAAGIDGLNPIEKAAGMDVYELRRLYPELTLVGGVDVTHLLPFGTPDEVRAETRRIINETGSEGRLLIGSSTELDDTVPLENYLTFRNEVMQG